LPNLPGEQGDAFAGFSNIIPPLPSLSLLPPSPPPSNSLSLLPHPPLETGNPCKISLVNKETSLITTYAFDGFSNIIPPLPSLFLLPFSSFPLLLLPSNSLSLLPHHL
jgi:hypothetical protein